MQRVKLDYVVSCTSEDPNHPASNLLSNPGKKWKCKSKGEILASVIFQLKQATTIAGIDVGNEHAAYVEVLVARAGRDEFKTLLVMRSLMSAGESRASAQPNQVRSFAFADFEHPIRDERWDRVKVSCTQPFNRRVQYGLAFVQVYTGGGPAAPAAGDGGVQKPAIAPTEPTRIKPKAKAEEPKTIAEAMRAASPATPNAKNAAMIAKLTAASSKRDELEKTQLDRQTAAGGASGEEKPKKRNRNELLYSDDEDDDAPSSSSRANTPKKAKIRKKAPFKQLLQGIVFVISGVKNPERANLKQKGLDMGAKYKADWDSTCTHLVSAFANTPKVKLVTGKGKIVTKAWLEDCNSSRKYLPWRRYALKSNDQKPESDEEIDEDLSV